MNYHIQNADPAQQYTALAKLLNQFEPDPIAAADIREWDRRNAENILRRRVVSAATGEIIGYSVALQGPWNRPGEFFLWLCTDADHRGAGMGQQLYADALTFIQSHNGSAVVSEVGERELAGQRFAATQGFVQERHTFQSRLTLHEFNENAYAELVERVVQRGIHIYSLADVEDAEQALRDLYTINRASSLQAPGSRGTFPTFAEFRRDLVSASWYRPNGQWLAAAGKRVVGMCAVGYFAASNSMYNMMTGVDRAYQGRGIAQALKIVALRWAKAEGADHIRTNNNSENAAMLAINRKLGYTPEPGYFTFKKEW